MMVYRFSEFISEIRNYRGPGPGYRGPSRFGPAPFRPPIIKQTKEREEHAQLIALGLADEPPTLYDIDVDTLVPTKKDIERVEGLSYWQGTFYGNGSPQQASVTAMAKLIRDPAKMVRRAKAVVARWGTQSYTGYSTDSNGYRDTHTVTPWGTFKEGLQNMGFTPEQLTKIANYRNDA